MSADPLEEAAQLVAVLQELLVTAAGELREDEIAQYATEMWFAHEDEFSNVSGLHERVAIHVARAVGHSARLIRGHMRKRASEKKPVIVSRVLDIMGRIYDHKVRSWLCCGCAPGKDVALRLQDSAARAEAWRVLGTVLIPTVLSTPKLAERANDRQKVALKFMHAFSRLPREGVIEVRERMLEAWYAMLKEQRASLADGASAAPARHDLIRLALHREGSQASPHLSHGAFTAAHRFAGERA